MELVLKTEILLFSLLVLPLFPTPRSFLQILIAACPAISLLNSSSSVACGKECCSLYGVLFHKLSLMLFFLYSCLQHNKCCHLPRTQLTWPSYLYSTNMPLSEMNVKEIKTQFLFSRRGGPHDWSNYMQMYRQAFQEICTGCSAGARGLGQEPEKASLKRSLEGSFEKLLRNNNRMRKGKKVEQFCDLQAYGG